MQLALPGISILEKRPEIIMAQIFFSSGMLCVTGMSIVNFNYNYIIIYHSGINWKPLESWPGSVSISMPWSKCIQLVKMYSLLVRGKFLCICITFKFFAGSKRDEKRTKSLGSGSSVEFGMTGLVSLTWGSLIGSWRGYHWLVTTWLSDWWAIINFRLWAPHQQKKLLI